MPDHHIHPQMLMEYAAGSLPRPMAMLVATHITLCEECRAHRRAFEAIGGALLEKIPPAELAESSLDAMLARLDETHEDAAAPARAENQALVGDSAVVPEPLRSAIAEVAQPLHWRRLGIGLQEIVLPGSGSKIRASLLKISPGASMPTHTHGGTELTLVLAGGFSDAAGHYRRGDVTLADGNTNHRPVADKDGDCLCFAVVDGGILLSGSLGRVANLMLRL